MARRLFNVIIPGRGKPKASDIDDLDTAIGTKVNTAVTALVDSAPASLDTLKELATALGNDANFAANLVNTLAGKAPVNHTHTTAAITNFDTAVSDKFKSFLMSTGAAGSYGKAIAIGDSLTGNGVRGSGTVSTYWDQRNAFMWFQAKAGYPYIHNAQYNNGFFPCDGHNVGVGGTTTSNMIARLRRDVIRKNPKLVIDWGATNDLTRTTAFTASRLANEIVRNKVRMVEEEKASGAWVWLHTILARNNDDGKALTAMQEQARLLVNAQLKTLYANDPQVVVFDLDTLFGVTGGATPSQYLIDGLHINTAGADLLSDEYLRVWRAKTGAQRANYPRSVDYDSYAAPMGNLLTASDFASGGGIFNGTSGNANVPASWRIETSNDTNAALTIVPSIVTRTDIRGNLTPFSRQVISSNGAGTADSARTRIRPSANVTTGLIPYRWYKGVIEVNIDAKLSGANILRSFFLELTDTVSGTVVRKFNLRGSYTKTVVNPGTVVKDYVPDKAFTSLILETPPILVTGTGGVQFYVLTECDDTLVGSRAIEFGNAELIPVGFQPHDIGPSPLVDPYTFVLPNAANGTYPVMNKYPFSGFMRAATLQTASGTCTVQLRYTPPGGSPVNIGSAINVTSTAQTVNFASVDTNSSSPTFSVTQYPTFPAGSSFDYVVTNNASGVNLTVTEELERDST